MILIAFQLFSFLNFPRIVFDAAAAILSGIAENMKRGFGQI